MVGHHKKEDPYCVCIAQANNCIIAYKRIRHPLADTIIIATTCRCKLVPNHQKRYQNKICVKNKKTKRTQVTRKTNLQSSIPDIHQKHPSLSFIPAFNDTQYTFQCPNTQRQRKNLLENNNKSMKISHQH